MIYIIGFGAIGRALSLFLVARGRRVTVIRGSVNDGSRTQEEVVVELADGTLLTQTIPVVTLDAVDHIDGLVVLTTKSFGNKDLALKLASRVQQTPVVILQNGLNVEAPFTSLGFRHIYRCVLFSTSLILENGVVRFRPVTDSPVGTIQGDVSTLQEIVSQINTPWFPFREEQHIQQVIWKKAIMNTVFNSICPLLETDNGIFYRDAFALHIAQKLISSCLAVAAKAGVHLSPEEIETGLINISKASAGQSISTLQDISNGRQTEIDTLNFEIFRIAQQQGMEATANDILLLGELIKLKEQINLKS
ncbi:2-dehydropantoate 2-reductase [Chitinophaga sp.]|uniref:ketopantoate reductase family protein n=1 Tax=Chitinophaga sp. TaxID=1869181 RepID=UPI0031D44B04